METSSPLAAMHCPAAAPFGRRDVFTSLHVRLSPGKPRAGRGLAPGGGAGAAPLTIRDQLNQDHFGPVHGSSPAGSLAADLCQNFTIGDDASPRFPTPRRALFTTGHAAAVQKRGFFKSRPLSAVSPALSLASSSPVSVADLMDMTPVPVRKAPVAVARDVVPPSSPSPACSSPADEMMLESPCPAPPPQPLQPATTAQEPARPLTSGLEKFPRRASLTRVKGYSFAAPSSRGHTDASQLPFFRFGDSRLPTAPAAPSSLSLSECFQDSPPSAPAQAAAAAAAAAASADDLRPQTANSPCANMGAGPLRTRPSLVAASSAGSSAASSRAGSPAVAGGIAHMRRQSSSFIRSRRQYRRSLSMFDNAGDLLKPKPRDDHHHAALQTLQTLQPSLLPSVMDTDSVCDSSSSSSSSSLDTTAHGPTLPHFFAEDQGDAIPRIGRDTLLQVLDGAFDDRFDQKLLIDCRFEYEYAGGHISEAINYNDKDLLVAELFQRGGAAASGASGASAGGPAAAAVAAAAAAASSAPGRTLIVLHCEYSAHRAPLMGRHVRAEDRAVNAEHYPRLSYPELYILDGGYSGFFGEHPGRCYPQAYVEMDAAEHAFACERAMGRLRQTQNRKGLHRAQTFAFGQHGRAEGDGLLLPMAAATAAAVTTATATAPAAPSAAAPIRSLFDRFDHRPALLRARATAGDDSEPVSTTAGPFATASAGSSPSALLAGGSPILGLDRRHARRMASY